MGRMRDWPDAWLSEDPLPEDPLPILVGWLDEAFAAGVQPNPHAFALATTGARGKPEARMVLCKGLEPATGSLLFYTHRSSPKGRALATTGRAAAAFYFGPQDRQARLEGPIGETSDAESDAYFATRPLDAQLAAWVSRQSEPVASRAALESELGRWERHFYVSLDDPGQSSRIPRPPDFCGYRLFAERVELWHSRPGRLHDRAAWSRALGPAPDFTGGHWRAERLQP
jgi:pyridoxamine 5'-phosphate oxidase